ncbi:hypothetical protein [Pinirhizobacter soli]|uniref:hypothetical protein n=1 Tax=Pinirhizobacter soli TaxID=2786953 RepID=UPI00202A2AB5|nr:hypothetical protein [Pinirhizobacter soli]
MSRINATAAVASLLITFASVAAVRDTTNYAAPVAHVAAASAARYINGIEVTDLAPMTVTATITTLAPIVVTPDAE